MALPRTTDRSDHRRSALCRRAADRLCAHGGPCLRMGLAAISSVGLPLVRPAVGWSAIGVAALTVAVVHKGPQFATIANSVQQASPGRAPQPAALPDGGGQHPCAGDGARRRRVDHWGCKGWGARFSEFVAGYSAADSQQLAESILARSEAAMREAIRAFPDGTHVHDLQADGHCNRSTTLRATVEIHGSELRVDYAGSSPERADAGVNCVLNTTHAHTIYRLKCSLLPDLPDNDGFVPADHVECSGGIDRELPLPCAGEGALEDQLPSSQCDLRRSRGSVGGKSAGRKRLFLVHPRPSTG